MRVEALENGFYRITTFRAVESASGELVNVVDTVDEVTQAQLIGQKSSLEASLVAMQERLNLILLKLDGIRGLNNET